MRDIDPDDLGDLILKIGLAVGLCGFAAVFIAVAYWIATH